jgi:uncharacterized protein
MPKESQPEAHSVSAARDIAADLDLPLSRVRSAIALLNDGNTIPFIAR